MNRISLSVASFILATSTMAQAGDAALSGANARSAEQGKKSQTVIRAGAQPSSEGPAEYFTGNVRVSPLFPANPSTTMTGAYVTFESGARSA